jgi:hypothetical protein
MAKAKIPLSKAVGQIMAEKRNKPMDRASATKIASKTLSKAGELGSKK